MIKVHYFVQGKYKNNILYVEDNIFFVQKIGCIDIFDMLIEPKLFIVTISNTYMSTEIFKYNMLSYCKEYLLPFLD